MQRTKGRNWECHLARGPPACLRLSGFFFLFFFLVRVVVIDIDISPSGHKVVHRTIGHSFSASLSHSLLISLTFSLCTSLPGSFALLLTHGYLVSSMLKQKPLANALSLIVLKSNAVLSLLKLSHSVLPRFQTALTVPR